MICSRGSRARRTRVGEQLSPKRGGDNLGATFASSGEPVWSGRMLFNSRAFLLVFLPLALLIYALASRSERWRLPVLLLISVAFYGYWDVRFVPLIVGSILIKVQYYMLDAATQRVFSDAVTLTETSVTPVLERRHDG